MKTNKEHRIIIVQGDSTNALSILATLSQRLDEGWTIERVDTAGETFIYILSRNK